MHKDDAKITLVGGGLVGSLLAIYLGRRGFEVDLFERRPDMRREQISAGRSINLALSTRGLHALREVGLEQEVLEHVIPMRGRRIHAPDGTLTYQAYGKDESDCIYSISRGELNKILLTRAEEAGARIHFRKNLIGADLENATLQIQDDLSTRIEEYPAEVVIGTDGSASRLRQTLQEASGVMSQEALLDYGYKELLIPAGVGGVFKLEKNSLHIWPRGTFVLIALANQDGSFTCTLFLPFKGENSFERINDAAEVSSFFGKYFGDVVPLFPRLVENFIENPTGHMVTIKSHPWTWRGRALLMGDAAHAIVPFFGQGMNYGFEDCSILNEILSNESSWEKTFSRFFAARKPNADAIADMAVENFVEMRDKVGDRGFSMQKELEKLLQKEFPGKYVSRYQLVTFSTAPYRQAYEVGLACSKILDELCRDLSVADQFDRRLAAE